MTDYPLIKIFLDKKNLDKYVGYIKEEILSDESKVILRDIKAFFNETKKESISVSELATWFHHIRHPDYKDAQHDKYKIYFSNLAKEQDQLVEEIIKFYKKEEFYYNIESLCIGRADPLEIQKICDEYKEQSKTVDKLYESNSFVDVFRPVSSSEGLKWPLECLNRSLGPIRKGHFGIVAAAVSKGKTAFLCQISGYMAQQLLKEQSVLYFNNEGSNEEVQMRIIQSVLNSPLHKIMDHVEEAEQKYTELLQGNINKIKVIDSNGLTMTQIINLVKQENAGLVIIDLLSKLTGHETKAGNETQRLTKVCEDLSALSIKYCPVLVAHQCDASVQGVRDGGELWSQHYITMQQLSMSKVGIQGAGNFIITIGFDYKYDNTRYIHVAKNKLPRLRGMYPEDRLIKAEVAVDWDRIRYSD